LVFLTFTGEFRGTEKQKEHLHESPALITFPLVVLALLAAVGGVLGLPEFLGCSHFLKNFLSPVLAGYAPIGGEGAAHEGLSHGTELALMGGAFAGALLSIGYAYTKYVSGKALPAKEGELKGLKRLVYNKYCVDEIYNMLVVKPVMFSSEVFHSVIDRTFIDAAVNFSGKFSLSLGAQIRKIQSGYIGFYLLAMVISIAAIFAFVFLIR